MFTGDEFIVNIKEKKFFTMNVDINCILRLATDEVRVQQRMW